MFKDTFEISELAQNKSNRQLDSIILYDKTFTYPNEPHIQYLDSYITDFIFVYDFPKVMEAIAKKMDKQHFREMLKSAARTNWILSKDGELLRPEAQRLIENQWHGYLFNDFLGEDSDKYIIRGDYFKKNNPDLDKNSPKKQIIKALNTNRMLCTVVLSNVKSEIDYHNTQEKSFMQWLMSYNKEQAVSRTASPYKG